MNGHVLEFSAEGTFHLLTCTGAQRLPATALALIGLLQFVCDLRTTIFIAWQVDFTLHILIAVLALQPVQSLPIEYGVVLHRFG